MSDVSSDNLSSSDEDERRNRSVAQIPEVPEPTFPVPEQPVLTEFWKENPVRDLDSLFEPELEYRLELAEEISEFLKKAMDELEEQYKAEWIAKERLLDTLFRQQLGNDAPIFK